MQVHQFLGTFFTNLAAGCASGCAPPRSGDTILQPPCNVAELFFNHSSTETFRDKLLKVILADSLQDGQEPEKTEITR